MFGAVLDKVVCDEIIWLNVPRMLSSVGQSDDTNPKISPL